MGVNYRIHYYGHVSSTQEIARELLASGGGEGTVVVADEQGCGHGRRGRTWVSPPGGLYASLILTLDSLLPLRVGIAVAEALRESGIKATVKWPNDVLVEERKIAGILIESVGDCAIVGIGVNLTASPVAAATCVVRETVTPPARDDLLEMILRHLSPSPTEGILKRYCALSATIGRPVRVETGTSSKQGTIIGRAVGIDSTGCLLVEAAGTLHVITSGDCVHLRVASPEGIEDSR